MAAHAFGEFYEIDAGQFEAWHVAHLHYLAERTHRAIAGVVNDDHRERQVAPGRGPQRLDRIHRRAVADQADGAHARTSQRDADGGRKAVAEAAARHGVKTVLTAHRH